jgi:56kDa selenium binding protein (SBP56)
MPAHPDPTFHASAKLAMQAPPEKLAYTVMLSPDFSQPDALAVVDLDPGSKSFSHADQRFGQPNRLEDGSRVVNSIQRTRFDPKLTEGSARCGGLECQGSPGCAPSA